MRKKHSRKSEIRRHRHRREKSLKQRMKQGVGKVKSGKQ